MGAAVRHARRDRRRLDRHALPACAVHPSLVRLAQYHPDRAGADCGRRRHARCCCARSRGNTTTSRSSWCWRCSRCPMPGSASACIPTSCRRASRSGRRPRPRTARLFMLFGVAVLIPLILGYTAWAYYVFRGKVQVEAGIIDADQQGPAPARAALAVVCGAVARRRRHRVAGLLCASALDRAEMMPFPAVFLESAMEIRDIPVTYPLYAP